MNRWVGPLAFAVIVVFLTFVWILNIKTMGMIDFHEQILRIEHTATAQTKANTKQFQFHYVFSTGCNSYQDWQSYTLFFHAYKTGLSERAHITRVASGCTEQGGIELQRIFKEQIESISSSFRLFLTPEYSNVIPGKDYHFFNKPFGLRFWMENALGFPKSTEHDDIIFVVLDPDQLVTRPIEIDYTPYIDSMDWVTPQQSPLLISHGHPASQQYLMGGNWVNMIQKNLTKIFETMSDDEAASSPLLSITAEDAVEYYNGGPPYIATGRDMYLIVSTWAQIAIPVYNLTDNFLSEMFAYSAASAHVGLKHHLSRSFMVSHARIKGEAWRWVDAKSGSEVCNTRTNYADAVKASRGAEYLPNVIHFCQRYFLGPFFFNKYKLPEDFISCHQPLLKEPDLDVTQSYSEATTPDGTRHVLNEVERKRHAFMLCNLISLANDAASYWKQQHCQGLTANFEKTTVFLKVKSS